MLEKIASESTIAERVTKQLRQDIIRKNIEAGSRITIKEIAEQYGVSPMPVREAFRTLEGETFLKINAYKGATVMKLDKGFVAETYDLLRALECLAYETALPSLDSDAFQQLRNINGEIRRVRDEGVVLERYIMLNTQFHELIMSRAQNKKAVELISYYQMLISSLREKYVPTIGRISSVLEEHEQIIAALEAGDIYALKKAVDTHALNAEESFLMQYSEEG